MISLSLPLTHSLSLSHFRSLSHSVFLSLILALSDASPPLSLGTHLREVGLLADVLPDQLVALLLREEAESRGRMRTERTGAGQRALISIE
jgi:hypothetical protein